MSTATPVPETRDLEGDEARETLRACGRMKLVRDAFVRLRAADGFSHARSLAFMSALVLVEAIISLVGLATALGSSEVSRVIVRTLKAAAPGPAGQFLTETVTQAHRAGVTHRYAGLVFGLVAALISGSTWFGQLERGFNRIYGVEQDRPTIQKYGLAFVLTLSVGALTSFAFAALAFGNTIGESLHNDALSEAWSILRWPLGLAVLTLAVTLLLRISPRRHQPHPSWLVFGAAVTVVLWALCTIGLGAFFSLSSSFGDTYGPLAGILVLLIWALLSAIVILLGAAVAAQLEAIRHGVPAPKDVEKVAQSEPQSSVLMSAGR
jgi:YihY family inner membrane protein